MTLQSLSVRSEGVDAQHERSNFTCRLINSQLLSAVVLSFQFHFMCFLGFLWCLCISLISPALFPVRALEWREPRQGRSREEQRLQKSSRKFQASNSNAWIQRHSSTTSLCPLVHIEMMRHSLPKGFVPSVLSSLSAPSLLSWSLRSFWVSPPSSTCASSPQWVILYLSLAKTNKSSY